MGSIKIEEIIPWFNLQVQNGNLFDINSILDKNKHLTYFYPKDDKLAGIVARPGNIHFISPIIISTI